MEYLASSGLNILHQGNEPTSVIRKRRNVIDLTLGTDWTENLARNWHVFDDSSLPDHRYIMFQTGNVKITNLPFAIPKELTGCSIRRT
jgi:hypothetical protein